MHGKKRATTVTEQLKEAIRASGKSLNQLGKDSGVATPQLSRFMQGKRTLTLPVVDKLCEALHLELTPTGKPRRRPAKEGE
jgi:transcriptional regulator with XRE-family HTH domain